MPSPFTSATAMAGPVWPRRLGRRRWRLNSSAGWALRLWRHGDELRAAEFRDGLPVAAYRSADGGRILHRLLRHGRYGDRDRQPLGGALERRQGGPDGGHGRIP